MCTLRPAIYCFQRCPKMENFTGTPWDLVDLVRVVLFPAPRAPSPFPGPLRYRPNVPSKRQPVDHPRLFSPVQPRDFSSTTSSLRTLHLYIWYETSRFRFFCYRNIMYIRSQGKWACIVFLPKMYVLNWPPMRMESLKVAPIAGKVISWNDIKLLKHWYFCPICKANAFGFAGIHSVSSNWGCISVSEKNRGE